MTRFNHGYLDASGRLGDQFRCQRFARPAAGVSEVNPVSEVCLGEQYLPVLAFGGNWQAEIVRSKDFPERSAMLAVCAFVICLFDMSEPDYAKAWIVTKSNVYGGLTHRE
jgi:hypothetical protein